MPSLEPALAPTDASTDTPKVDGLKPYTGGEELRRAIAALAGPNPAQQREDEGQGSVRASPSSSPEGPAAPHAALIPINVTSLDHSTRELALAAQRYAKATQRDPGDFDAVYNHGLALQELASRITASGADQMRLLTQACERYEAAWRLREGSHAALYNWGVALSDMSRAVKQSDRAAAHGYLLAAAGKYATSLRWNPNNPQALNNWGLVLQELSAMGGPGGGRERGALVAASVAKFRGAIRLRPEFDRACYNLGTVYYSHAHALQAAAQSALSSQLTKDAARQRAEQAEAADIVHAFCQAAQYIALAYALQPGRDIYQRSLKVVAPLLPGGHLRAGFLLAADPATQRTTLERWHRQWWVLDHEGFRTAAQPGPSVPDEDMRQQEQQRVDLADVLDAKLCMDPSLPEGYAIWLALHSQPQGIFLISEAREDADGWVDGLLMTAHIAASQQLPALASALGAGS